MSYTDKMLRDDALKGKVIVVTGGGSGLGKAMTKYFLELGAQVAITSRDLEKLKNTAKELETETGGTCLPLQCDVRHYDEVENMLQEVLKAFGKVDVLLNNAAGNFISPTERLSANAFDTVIDIVLKGSKNCTLAFGKHQTSLIINIEYSNHLCLDRISLCSSKRYCQSRGSCYDQKPCCRMGKIWYTYQCHCTRTIPYERRMG
jgi:NAD(P)-dependent dehydrogenase (short-subunit alcohol dehydrogenase family)